MFWLHKYWYYEYFFLFVTRIRIFFLHKHRRYPLLRNKPPRTFIFSELINLFVMSDNEAFLTENYNVYIVFIRYDSRGTTENAKKLKRRKSLDDHHGWKFLRSLRADRKASLSDITNRFINSENINVRGGLLRSKGYRRCLCRKKIRIGIFCSTPWIIPYKDNVHIVVFGIVNILVTCPYKWPLINSTMESLTYWQIFWSSQHFTFSCLFTFWVQRRW
jgi:hypothetical protein